MMKFSELSRFLMKRYKQDTKLGFVCRIARFGLLSVPIAIAETKARGLRQNGYRYIVENIHGSDMLLNPHDRGIGSDLLLYGNREPLISTKFREILKEGMVVYDIGANIGYYALQESRIVGKSGYIYAIEPIPYNIQVLEKNIHLNGYKNIEVHNLAIGERPYNGRINVSGMSNLSTMLDKSGYRHYEGDIPVRVESVDSFSESQKLPDVIRMDTEGFEVNIVRGMKRLLNMNKPLILFIEVHFDMLRGNVIEMLRTLKDAGFKVKVATHETHPVVQNSWLLPLVNLCEKGMGATGYMDVTLDDLMTKKCFIEGQVENMEIIFERV